ncbi:MAG: glycoside hydrolase family 172 protein [Bryobacteraceae bacterium]
MAKHFAPRRGFLQRLAGFAGVSAAAAAGSSAQAQTGPGGLPLPWFARAQNYKSLKQSSHDTTGGNADRWPIKPGDTQEVFNSKGPGVVTHIWFTIAAQSRDHLKEVVLRMYWDGNSKPSVETPVGDFFGLNLGQYNVYQSAFLNNSPIRALNCYFPMPFRTGARITVTNEGKLPIGAFYSNIDYQLVPSLPADALYFHAQYRQKTPTDILPAGDGKNPDGSRNYVYAETRGRGHLMGVTLGWVQNAENWMGEGDDMIFIDDEAKPIIIGTGSEDYFCGAWNFGGRDTAVPFAHLYNGAHLITAPEHTGGRYCLYRWHADNPVTFTRYMKHTMEHGHANDRADNYYSVCYWYQDKPYTDFPALPPVEQRIPVLKMVPRPGGVQPA